ncbi:MAG: glycosyltransferase, partial [Patescibacteria group bacterium]|nr:glycosyltransferase [Patescibacteria group bacterium]
MTAKPIVVIVTGKHPLTSSGGYATIAKQIARICTTLGYETHMVCMGKKTIHEQTPIGTIHTCTSPLQQLPFSQTFPLAGLLFFSFTISRKILNLFQGRTILVWGVGPWTLAGILVKRMKRGKTTVVAEYFTSIKHEFLAGLDAVQTYPYSLILKLVYAITALTLIPVLSFLERFVCSKSDRIVTHYASTEQILNKEFGILQKKFIRLPYYLKPLRKKRTQQGKLPLLLTITRHDARKGIPVLLNAYALLQKRGIAFSAVIIGDGNLLATHKNLSRKL